MDTRSKREDAWMLHQDGKLAEAERAYKVLLETIPDDATLQISSTVEKPRKAEGVNGPLSYMDKQV